MFLLVEKLSAWWVVGLYLALWLLVALLVHSLLKRWFTALVASHRHELNEVLAGSIPRPAAFGVFLAAISAGLKWLPLPETVSKDVRDFLPLVIGIVAIFVAMRVSLRAIDAYGRSRPELKSTAGIGRFLTWIIGIAAMALFVSEALGISLAPALTALGVGSLAVGLGLQDTLSNFFSGVYLLVDKPVRPGDLIKVDAFEGTVEAIGWRSTHLRTAGNNLVVVPNATLSKAIITNYQRPSPAVGSDVRVEVANDNDPDAVEAILVEEAKRAVDIDGIVADSAPVVRFAPGFVDGVFAYTIYFQARTVGDQFMVQHVLRKRVLARLRAAQVKLATPALVKR
jgi:small-conductance mechanosensitive channel